MCLLPLPDLSQRVTDGTCNAFDFQYTLACSLSRAVFELMRDSHEGNGVIAPESLRRSEYCLITVIFHTKRVSNESGVHIS